VSADGPTGSGSRHLGLDLGGTNVKWAVVEHDGDAWTCLDRGQFATPISSGEAAVIDRLVRNAPLSLRAMKATINRQMAFRDGIEHADTDDLVRTAMRSADAKEGVRARMDRRDADFTGV